MDGMDLDRDQQLGVGQLVQMYGCSIEAASEAMFLTPPSEAQLTFRDPARAELIDKAILFRWPAVGWCLGKITQANTDARRTIKGVKCNFFIYYELDQDTSQHTLALNAYGADDGWVLLEPM